MRPGILFWCGCLWSVMIPLLAADAPHPLRLITPSHPTAPWEGFRNRLLPAQLPVIKQDFGYRSTTHCGGNRPGEIGGLIHRSPVLARYARPTPPSNFEQPLSASGTFTVRKADGGSGLMIGWLNTKSRGWRTPNSLAIRLDGNGGKFWVFFEYGTRQGKTGGLGAFEGERYQTTRTRPFLADGSRHRWKMSYQPDPATGGGTGLLEIDGQTYPPLSIPQEHRRDGAQFDLFGIWNVQIAGGEMEAYFDDLTISRESLLFDEDPRWPGLGNQQTHTERIIRPFHDFGDAMTPGGECVLGGTIFRDERPAYVAQNVGKLTLDDPLFAAGRVKLSAAAADSGCCLGWFQAEAKRTHPVPEHERRVPHRLGVMIEGPSRVGHYFRADYVTSAGTGYADNSETPGVGTVPVIPPDDIWRPWSLRYDPQGENGRGTIVIDFDGNRRRVALRPGDRQRGATFDHFGMYNLQSGGHHVQLWFDQLEFTAGPQ